MRPTFQIKAQVKHRAPHQQLVRDLAQCGQPLASRRTRSRHQIVQQAAVQPLQHLSGESSWVLV